MNFREFLDRGRTVDSNDDNDPPNNQEGSPEQNQNQNNDGEDE
ncbi:hypothetical protein WCWAEYFT_CDS0164 [Vibrio phage VB_VaC_TDDLMA]